AYAEHFREQVRLGTEVMINTTLCSAKTACDIVNGCFRNAALHKTSCCRRQNIGACMVYHLFTDVDGHRELPSLVGTLFFAITCRAACVRVFTTNEMMNILPGMLSTSLLIFPK